MRLKKGDIVVANDNFWYTFTNKANKWIGRVTKVVGTRFEAETISCTQSPRGEKFEDLRADRFITLNQAVKEGFPIDI